MCKPGNVVSQPGNTPTHDPVGKPQESQVELNAPLLALNLTETAPTPTTHTHARQAGGDSTVIICHLQAWVAAAWRWEEMNRRKVKRGQRMPPLMCAFVGRQTCDGRSDTLPQTHQITSEDNKELARFLKREHTALALWERSVQRQENKTSQSGGKKETEHHYWCICGFESVLNSLHLIMIA